MLKAQNAAIMVQLAESQNQAETQAKMIADLLLMLAEGGKRNGLVCKCENYLWVGRQYYTNADVARFVVLNRITEEQYKQITGLTYPATEPVVIDLGS